MLPVLDSFFPVSLSMIPSLLASVSCFILIHLSLVSYLLPLVSLVQSPCTLFFSPSLSLSLSFTCSLCVCVPSFPAVSLPLAVSMTFKVSHRSTSIPLVPVVEVFFSLTTPVARFCNLLSLQIAGKRCYISVEGLFLPFTLLRAVSSLYLCCYCFTGDASAH